MSESATSTSPTTTTTPSSGSSSSAANGSTPPAAKTEATEPQSFSVEYVRELRAESKGYRLKAQETEQQKLAALKERDDAKTEADKRIAEVNTAADQRVIRAELKAVALKAGMVDLDGLKLADLSKVKMNDKGEVDGADALIEGLKKDKPYLFGATGSTSSTHTPPPADKTKPKHARDMTEEEYAAARAKAVNDARRRR